MHTNKSPVTRLLEKFSMNKQSTTGFQTKCTKKGSAHGSDSRKGKCGRSCDWIKTIQ
jgi:hypothetical protein